jgi:hypothetical protein
MCVPSMSSVFPYKQIITEMASYVFHWLTNDSHFSGNCKNLKIKNK